MKISYFDNKITILESMKMDSRKIDILDKNENFILKGYISKDGTLKIMEKFETRVPVLDIISQIYDIKNTVDTTTNSRKKETFQEKYVAHVSNTASIFNKSELYRNYYEKFFLFNILEERITAKEALREQGIQYAFLIMDKFIDHLTGLPNVGFFNHITGLRDEDKEPIYQDHFMSIKYNHININDYILFFDLNNLKAMNDVYGHEVADTMLIEYSKTIIEEFPDSLHFRTGGDEFVTIVKTKKEAKDMVSRTNSLEFSKKIHKKINKEFNVVIDTNLLILSSGGYTHYNKEERVNSFLNMSEKKMYLNKRYLHLKYGVYDREKKTLKNKVTDKEQLKKIENIIKDYTISIEEKMELLTYENIKKGNI